MTRTELLEIISNGESSGVDFKREEGVTVGGMLLFGKMPNRFLPHAGIDAAAFPGTQKDYAARERIGLRGPMAPLLAADGGLVENGLVEQANGGYFWTSTRLRNGFPENAHLTLRQGQTKGLPFISLTVPCSVSSGWDKGWP